MEATTQNGRGIDIALKHARKIPVNCAFQARPAKGSRILK